MAQSQSRTREGYQWTEVNGLQPGLPTIAAINPSTRIESSNDSYDAIVIGSGYAGLTAARDLTLAGASVMLLEARDRIGGRTWTANIDGHNFEIGGTYVHWAQPNLWREIARYQMQKGLDAAVDLDKGVTEISVITPAGVRVMDQEEQVSPLFLSHYDAPLTLWYYRLRFLLPPSGSSSTLTTVGANTSCHTLTIRALCQMQLPVTELP